MSDLKLRRILETCDDNVQTMSSWSWEKTSRHLDLIEQQLDWAIRQQNEIAIARLEECRRQVLTARFRQLDAEPRS